MFSYLVIVYILWQSLMVTQMNIYERSSVKYLNCGRERHEDMVGLRSYSTNLLKEL